MASAKKASDSKEVRNNKSVNVGSKTREMYTFSVTTNTSDGKKMNKHLEKIQKQQTISAYIKSLIEKDMMQNENNDNAVLDINSKLDIIMNSLSVKESNVIVNSINDKVTIQEYMLKNLTNLVETQQKILLSGGLLGNFTTAPLQQLVQNEETVADKELSDEEFVQSLKEASKNIDVDSVPSFNVVTNDSFEEDEEDTFDFGDDEV